MSSFEDERKHVGPGWQPLIEKLNADLLELVPTYEIMQIKEKFGGLRYYIAMIKTNNTPEKMREAWKLVRIAEEESYKICEECGSRDGVTTAGIGSRKYAWIRTLCGECRPKADEAADAGSWWSIDA